MLNYHEVDQSFVCFKHVCPPSSAGNMTLSLLQTCQHTPKRRLIKILLLVAIGVCLLLFQLCVHLLTLVKVDTALSDSQPLLQDDGNLGYLHYHSTQSSHKGPLPLCPRIPPGLSKYNRADEISYPIVLSHLHYSLYIS